jgi:hypothetical protein
MTNRTEEIKDWLVAKGFYVLSVGPEGSPDYLILSTEKPENFKTEKNEQGCVRISSANQPNQDLFVIRQAGNQPEEEHAQQPVLKLDETKD